MKQKQNLTKVPKCVECKHIVKDGKVTQRTGIYQRYVCTTCGTMTLEQVN